MFSSLTLGLNIPNWHLDTLIKNTSRNPKNWRWDIAWLFIPTDNAGKAKPFFMPG